MFLRKKIILKTLAAALVLAGCLAVFHHKSVPVAEAANNGNVTGWIWSDTIGWISLSGSNAPVSAFPYGVTQDTTTGAWTGYGWSDNVGWVQFGTGCPAGAAGTCNSQMNFNNNVGTLSGWARVISGIGNAICDVSGHTVGSSAGCWDGWISLSSTNDHDFTTAGVQASVYPYGLSEDANGNVAGFVFGGSTAASAPPELTLAQVIANGGGFADWNVQKTQVLGWMKAVSVKAPPHTSGGGNLVLIPSVALPATLNGYGGSISINSPQTVYLSWNSPNGTTYVSCVPQGANSSPTNPAWDGTTATPIQGPGYINFSHTTVPISASGQNIFTLACTRPDNTVDTVHAYVYLNTGCGDGCPVVSLTADNSTICVPPGNEYPSNATLTWSSSQADSCVGSGGDWGASTNLTPVSGGTHVTTAGGTYQVTCTNSANGGTAVSAPVTVVADSQCTTGNTTTGGGSSITLSAGTNLLCPNVFTTLYWNGTPDISGCSGNWPNSSNLTSPNGQSSNTIPPGTYTITCNSNNGTMTSTTTIGVDTPDDCQNTNVNGTGNGGGHPKVIEQ